MYVWYVWYTVTHIRNIHYSKNGMKTIYIKLHQKLLVLGLVLFLPKTTKILESSPNKIVKYFTDVDGICRIHYRLPTIIYIIHRNQSMLYEICLTMNNQEIPFFTLPLHIFRI